jgi:hypothetical protein
MGIPAIVGTKEASKILSDTTLQIYRRALRTISKRAAKDDNLVLSRL